MMTSMVLCVLLGVTAVLAERRLHSPTSNTAHDSILVSGPRHISRATRENNIVSSGPFAQVIKKLTIVSTGERDPSSNTTSVWAHKNHAYLGTGDGPCGDDPQSGVSIWDVSNKKDVSFVGAIPAPAGSITNIVKVATMNSGDILVHSNGLCVSGKVKGPGGFEIYKVDDPTKPVHLASVPTSDVNIVLQSQDFAMVDVVNVFLFTQASNDYVAVTVASGFGRLQIFDITDPKSPFLVGFWGPEQLHLPKIIDWVNLDDTFTIFDALGYLQSGFGAKHNKYVSDVVVSADGIRAYVPCGDAGVVLLDISDPTSPSVVSVAVDLDSEDGEINSATVWPSEDGTIVVEGEDDSATSSIELNINTGPNAGMYPALEGQFTTDIASLKGATMSGVTTYVGLACNRKNFRTGSGIALVQLGECALSQKAASVIKAGFSGMIVFNDELRNDATLQMTGTPQPIPGVFVGHKAGLFIAGVASAEDLKINKKGESVTVTEVQNGLGGYRIWDYSDPTTPVLASTFNTVCSADPTDSSCDPDARSDSHKVIVETEGKQVKAYLSWKDEGLLVVDITDPYNPEEVSRYTASGERYWDVYKIPNDPYIYASYTQSGFHIFKETTSDKPITKYDPERKRVRDT